jgi:chemotaxis protein CheD
MVRSQSVIGEIGGELRRRIVGIGELVVSDIADETIVTHALGSCVAVCLFDPVVRVAAMLHFMLPDSRINSERARQQPAAFADTGIPLLFQTAYLYGLEKRRTIVKLVGGAEITPSVDAAFRTGQRNALAAKQVLWRNGVLVNAEDTGGNTARTVHLGVQDGRVRVVIGRNEVKEI